MKKKKVLSLILTFALCAGLFAVPARAAFPDISDEATRTAATMLQNLGIVSGFNDGKFRPADKLTRAQFCKMAVLLSGMEDASSYAAYTIFPDVRAGHWARGYVNAAVRSLKIIYGFPDGTFRPDEPISFAQAATILVRMLGYSDADVGLNWPRGYLDKAAALGVTKGISLGANSATTRGLGAQMFYNTLFAKNKEGKQLSTALGIAERKNIVVLRTGATAPDGEAKGLLVLDGEDAEFVPCRVLPDIGAGTKGTLTTDGEGYFLSFAPSAQTKKELVAVVVTASTALGADGQMVTGIPGTARVFDGSEVTAWKDIWPDIRTGTHLRFFFTGAGAVDYVLFDDAASLDGTVHVLNSEPAAGQNPLGAFGLTANALVYKNGVPASLADLRQWDVVLCDSVSNTAMASDFRITAIFEDGLPNRETPSTVVTLGGQKFEVLPGAVEKLAKVTAGTAATFLFTHDRRVADVQPAAALPARQPGIVTGEDEVVLWDGTVLSGSVVTASAKLGQAVMACMQTRGNISAAVPDQRGGAALDITKLKAGTADIAPYAVVYDRCASDGGAAQVSLGRLPGSIPSSKVQNLGYDAAGRVNLIVLNNVTGDAWLYGFLQFTPGHNSQGFDDPFVPAYVTVKTPDGDIKMEAPLNIAHPADDTVVGVSWKVGGTALEIKTCVKATGVTRGDFSGNTAVRVGSVLLALPEDMNVYMSYTGKYVTVAEARVASNSFEVYLDDNVASGGQVRFIIAK